MNEGIAEENKRLTTRGDEIAIEQCRRGEIDGLELLAQRYQVTSLRLAFLLTGDLDAAQDIVQESFIRAYQRIHQFHDGQPFGPWFHRIVVNLSHQHRRAPAQNRVQAWEEGNDTRHSSDPLTLPEMVVEQQEMHDAMQAAINDLPKKQREVIILRYYLSYADQEIADIVRCTHAAVRQRLHAGRTSLHKIIRQQYPWLINEYQLFADTATMNRGEA